MGSPEEPLSLGLVLTGGLILVAAGTFAFFSLKPHRPKGAVATTAAEPSFTSPPPAAPAASPAGEIAWDPEARSPVLLPTAHAEGDDFFGFFRVWDGRSAWVAYGGVFDGATLATRWRTEPIDPQILKRDGVVARAAIVGPRIVVSDTSPVLRVFDLESGNKVATFKVADAVLEMCAPNEANPPRRIWAHVANEQNAVVDIESGKATFAPRPRWCPLPASPAPPPLGHSAKRPASSVKLSTCDDDFKNALAEATCLPEGPAPATAEADTHYLLKTKENAVALGTSAAGPIVSGIGPGFKVTWTTPLVDDGTKPLPGAPHIADLANGRLYVIYGKVYFDSRLAALDAENGKRLWDVPLVGSIGGVGSIGESGRGQAVALVASKSRVYVSRSGGGLDVFSATDGKSLGTVGKK